MAASYSQLPAVVSERPGSLRRTARAVMHDPLALFGLVVIGIVVIAAILGPWLVPTPATGGGEIDVSQRMLPPSRDYPFGTDWLGRSVFSRVVLGARIALEVSLVVVGLALLIGVPLGAVAGYRRGRLDGVIMRITDLFLAFPPLLLAMAIVAALGPGLQNATLALAISWWPWYARIARGLAASLREWPFVDAARAMGIREASIIVRHVIPNSLGPIVVQATIDVGTVVLAAGSLAFIGLGARPPAPDWGLMVAEGRQYILDQWWIATFPGLAIFFTVLAFNLVGDLLIRLLDPRQEP
jgi:peptide/nickel transport system permease protein